MPNRAIAGSCVKGFFFLSVFKKWPCWNIYILTSSWGEIQVFYILTNIWYCQYFYFSCFDRCVLMAHHSISLKLVMLNIFGELFLYALTHYSTWTFFFLNFYEYFTVDFESSLYILVLGQICDFQMFSCSMWLGCSMWRVCHMWRVCRVWRVCSMWLGCTMYVACL